MDTVTGWHQLDVDGRGSYWVWVEPDGAPGYPLPDRWRVMWPVEKDGRRGNVVCFVSDDWAPPGVLADPRLVAYLHQQAERMAFHEGGVDLATGPRERPDVPLGVYLRMAAVAVGEG